MKCIRCRAPAVYDAHRHNAGFCRDHFFEHFERQVVRAIEGFGMFGTDARILVAVSGGKDSLVLWDQLLRLGRAADGLYVDLGIDGYSAASRAKAEAFAEKRGARLTVVSLREDHGFTVPEAARRMHRPACASCGIGKRWIFNQAARQGGYDVVATGHNLDDEAATLLGNVLHWDGGHLSRQYPVLEGDAGWVRKVKPLVRLAERECAAYAVLAGIDYVLEECPHATGALSHTYKELLTRLENASAAAKHDFLHGFYERGRDHFASSRPGPGGLAPCTRCGQPTGVGLCTFCRMREKLKYPAEPAGCGEEVPPT